MHWSSSVPARKLRVRLALIRTLRCDLPDGLCLIFPFAVMRNRFLVALWVFILWVAGITRLLSFQVNNLELGILSPIGGLIKGN